MRSAIERKLLTGFEELTIDAVERIQGQEREVVVLSLAAGDPAEAKRGTAFHLSLNRLNVALSRAGTKAILWAAAMLSGRCRRMLPAFVWHRAAKSCVIA
ncbi:MAG: DNA replication ATP-dependent helicase Dna2 [Planctomycetota bacterium]|jgi:DNA replication ATP-dependent helicase Dna2